MAEMGDEETTGITARDEMTIVPVETVLHAVMTMGGMRAMAGIVHLGMADEEEVVRGHLATVGTVRSLTEGGALALPAVHVTTVVARMFLADMGQVLLTSRSL